MADQRNTEFWNSNKPAFTHEYEFCVSFGPYENVKNVRNENGNLTQNIESAKKKLEKF